METEGLAWELKCSVSRGQGPEQEGSDLTWKGAKREAPCLQPCSQRHLVQAEARKRKFGEENFSCNQRGGVGTRRREHRGDIFGRDSIFPEHSSES